MINDNVISNSQDPFDDDDFGDFEDANSGKSSTANSGLLTQPGGSNNFANDFTAFDTMIGNSNLNQNFNNNVNNNFNLDCCRRPLYQKQ